MKNMVEKIAVLTGVAALFLVMACPSPVVPAPEEDKYSNPVVEPADPDDPDKPADPDDPDDPADPNDDQPKYDITVHETEDGTVDIDPEDSQYEDCPVRITARPHAGKKYRPGSLRVRGKNSCETIETTPDEDSDTEWTFQMPGEDVEVDVSFIDETATLYGISIVQTAYGSIQCGQTEAVAGDTVTVSLLAADPDNYRYVPDSFTVIAADSGGRVNCTPSGDLCWAFTMPDEPVSVTADFEFIPYFSVRIAESVRHGCLTITGVETDGIYEGKAREGEIITVTAVPNPGYKLAGGLSAAPLYAVTVTEIEDRAAWTFIMADTDVEIAVAFAELGLLDIYKGAARTGITVGELADDKKYYTDSIDMESDISGHNGNHRSIKITHAANDKGNAVQQSFGLFSDTEIDLETVTALSFWAKANKPLNIRYVGFGDADPDKRVVYTGEKFDQSIPLTAEWNRYVVPVPAPGNGRKTTRVFMFNAAIALGNYVCIDDIEFIQSGVTLTDMEIAGANDGLFYGETAAAKILKGAPLKLTYACADGTTVTLQCASNSHTLKYNLASWLTPFIRVNGAIFSQGVISPPKNDNTITLYLSAAGIASNTMTAGIINGILIDDFEDLGGSGSITIPGNPTSGTGYLWHNTSSGSVAVGRDYFTVENKEIHSGLRAGNWRPGASANTPRGGRNFEAKDAADNTMLTFWIKVTTGGNTNIQSGTVFTFELRNGGLLTSKTNGIFFSRQFTYDPVNIDGWQEIKMPLADFINDGLDVSAITGYAFGVVDNQGVDLRIMLDDIALIK